MIPKISDIFQQKLNEIQSRVPVKITGSSDTVPFEKYLEDAAAKNSAASASATADARAAALNKGLLSSALNNSTASSS